MKDDDNLKWIVNRIKKQIEHLQQSRDWMLPHNSILRKELSGKISALNWVLDLIDHGKPEPEDIEP